MNKGTKMRLLSILLCIVMLVGLMPQTTMVTEAAEPTVIDEIVTIMAKESVPKAGMEVTHFIPNVPDDAPYERDWDGAEWYDSSGVKIAPTIDHHYDIGYEFEAGHTYYADYQYTADGDYVFAQNPIITLTGPDQSMFTYEIVDRWDNNRSVTVRYTFTIPGEIDCPDINKVSMMYYGTVAEGSKKPDDCEMIYNNCTITREEWNTGQWGSEANWGVFEMDDSNSPTFLAGERYVHMIELTAKDGYKFSQGLHVQKGRQSEEEYGVVTLSDDRTIATVKFTYDVGEYEIIDTVELVAANQHIDFCLRSGESIYLPQPFISKYALAADWPYETDGGSSYEWINNETGERLRLGYAHSFDAGGSYTLKFAVRIKDEYETTHKFASGVALDVSGYEYANSDFVKFKVSGGGQVVNVEVTYTAQFPKGKGINVSNPAMCYTYNEFKYAMENNDIRYVALGNMEDVLPTIPHDEDKNPGTIETSSIVVRGKKDLNLLGNAIFKCPLTNNYDVKQYVELIKLTDAANSDLYIHGEGSLTYQGSNMYFFNSAITVNGGKLCVDGTTIRGSNGYHTGYCYGINALYGNVVIQGGANIIGEVYSGDGVCALSVGEEGLNKSLSVSIWDGKFYVDRDVEDGNHDHGIWVNNDCGLRIYGGAFDGIQLNRYAADDLSEYIQNGCVMTINGAKVNPANYSTIDGSIVEVYKEIYKVDIHVNSPSAGETPTTYIGDIYLVPEGCNAESIVWYENGVQWNDIDFGNAHFEAGNTYKVEIVLTTDNGVKFANPLTSTTINYKKADVSAYKGNLEKGIVLSVDFGACPNTVSNVDLTVTAPKEGNRPSYTVGCASDAYKNVGNYNNYTDYRIWMESVDGQSNWRKMETTDTFVAGYYYKFYVDINTANGYEFPLYDNGTSIVPDVSATVNGYYASVIKAYDQDPSTYITVECNFGMCNDSTIENIEIVDVTEPVAGESPSYIYNILGNGYHMNSEKNNPQYGVKNGLQWWDTTTGSWEYVFEDDKFIPGHTYVCRVNLLADNDFEFAMDDGIPAVTATLNGYPAEVVDGWTNLSEARVDYEFTCKPAELALVMLADLDFPQADKEPDYTATELHSYYYMLDPNFGMNGSGIYWYDSEGNMMENGDKFQLGEQYKVEIKIVSKKIDGANISKFITPLTAYINGKEVTERMNWDAVFVSNDTVYLYYTFVGGATAPEIGAFVSGEVTSYGEGNDVVTLQLIKEGESSPAYETTVTGNEANYYFSDVETGKYTLKVSKAGHKTAEYKITVEGDSVTQNCTLQQIKYTVTFNANGGSGSMTAVKDVLGEYILPANKYTAPAGKRFKAWSVGGVEKEVGDVITVSANVTIKAVWEDIPEEKPTEAPTEVPTETPTEVPTEAPTGAPTNVPTGTPTEKPTSAPSPTNGPVADTPSTYTIGGLIYKITSADSKTVELVGTTNKKLKTLNVKATITIDGTVYKITSIGKAAFKNIKTLKSLTIGKNVTTIGNKAFFKCKGLKKVVIKAKKLKKVGAGAFKKANKKMTVKAPKKLQKKYKKLIKK